MQVDELDEGGEVLEPFSFHGPAVRFNLEPLKEWGETAKRRLEAGAEELRILGKRIDEGGIKTKVDATEGKRHLSPIRAGVAAAEPIGEKAATGRILGKVADVQAAKAGLAGETERVKVEGYMVKTGDPAYELGARLKEADAEARAKQPREKEWKGE